MANRVFIYNNWGVPLLILVCSFFLYGNSIRNNYSLDDSLVISANQSVQKGLDGIPGIFNSKTFKDEKSSYAYRPVPLMTFAIENQIFKNNPHISHLFSIILYSFICILLFLILRLIFPAYFFLSVLTTFLFLFHPIHTEVVNNIKCRDELLMMLFSFSAFYFFIKYCLFRKFKFFLYAMPLILIAFLCKKSALAFSLIIPATLFFSIEKIPIRKILFIFFSIISFYLLFIVIRNTLTIDDDQARTLQYFENPLYFSKAVSDRIPSIFSSLLFYLKLLFFPWNLSFYYGFDQVPVPNWNNFLPYLGMVITASIFFFIIFFYRKQKIISLGILLFGIGISIFLNIIPLPGIVAERYAFISSFGWSISIAGILLFLFKIDMNKPPSVKNNLLFYGLILFIFGSFATRIISRNPDWKDQLTLFEHDIKYLNSSAKAHSMLAGELIAAGESEKDQIRKNNFLTRAIRHYEKSIEIFPGYASALNNVGTIYFMNFGQTNRAIPYFEKALDADSLFAKASFNLAFAHEKTGNIEQAIHFYEKTIELDSNFVQAFRNLGKIFFRNNWTMEAMKLTKKAIRFNPETPALYVDAANYSIMEKDTLECIKNFETAFILESDVEKKHQLGKHLFQLFKMTGDKQKMNYYSGIENESQLKKAVK